MKNFKKLALIAVLSFGAFVTTSVSADTVSEAYVTKICHLYPATDRCAELKEQLKKQESSVKKDEKTEKKFPILMATFGACMANTPVDKLVEKFSWWKNEISYYQGFFIREGISDININLANHMRTECGLGEIETFASPIEKPCK